jgi:hypothetical protein
MTAFETVCQMWSKEYIPILERWGFKVTEVPREPADYLLGEKRWDIERGEKTKASLIIYAFRWEKDGIRINFAPVCSRRIYHDAAINVRWAFDEIVSRLVVSAAIRRHVRYLPYFKRKLGRKEVQFSFRFMSGKNGWQWWARVVENQRLRKEPYEVAGTPEMDPIAAFPAFEKAVWFELLV